MSLCVSQRAGTDLTALQQPITTGHFFVQVRLTYWWETWFFNKMFWCMKLANILKDIWHVMQNRWVLCMLLFLNAVIQSCRWTIGSGTAYAVWLYMSNQRHILADQPSSNMHRTWKYWFKSSPRYVQHCIKKNVYPLSGLLINITHCFPPSILYIFFLNDISSDG